MALEADGRVARHVFQLALDLALALALTLALVHVGRVRCLTYNTLIYAIV
jgi:hypothetical protein